ncbi:hypothetical protein TCAL_07827 [Tigriopus californicus]|uniref:SEC7 domain-containing protein n=1 Tax=Tigriopus californicus TaxID=6832 RepID=A0A553NQ53_TIGCA|nr:Golgi-specific brefeldin A-resistance guanine nucleotide exchange factor 1-like [Tigriopus californicus]TRY67573.1 hypothetical protein TCAL_07827 [Tigriopus californicus]|eukprot:TCALIF_07827-PA protein Name:"Similar to GBF1 Golgi-specific brefeldin A-resistance guanine nucleotide exchange factor 1 (Homo sapiens)" AED:0.00 eAED:0.00 QI:285/1/1/1/0/1/2/278/1953
MALTVGRGPVGVDRGVAIVEAEIAALCLALKRGHSQTWSRHHSPHEDTPASLHPTLLRACLTLKRELSAPENGHEPDPHLFLAPFLDVIRSETVTGPITGLALSAVQKFLNYGLLRADHPHIGPAVENLADAVTHARFVGVDPGADEVVLMKIMEVLRTLMLSPVGLLLTNESVCEIMQSTFRICFETRLSELLRKTAEHALNDMIQLLFTRLPTFTEENLPLLKKLKMRSSHGEGGKTHRKPAGSSVRSTKTKPVRPAVTTTSTSPSTAPPSSTTTEVSIIPQAPPTKPVTSPESSQVSSVSSPTVEAPPNFNVDADVLARSPSGSVTDLSVMPASPVESPLEEGPSSLPDMPSESDPVAITVTSPKGTETPLGSPTPGPEEVPGEADANESEFTNAQGVTFTPTVDAVDEGGSLIPYGLPCVRELFRFLISLTNPHDSHNQDAMIQIALNLLATALETGAEHLDCFKSLLELARDDLARNLVSHLSTERINVFATSLWVSYMLYEAQRKHLKFQLEIYLTKLIEVVCSESQKVTYEHKELALDIVVRYYRIPGFLTQLYLNFDCDLYTSNIFEDLTKMLSKNAFPVSGLYSTHFLSLDALLTVIEAIESQCQKRITSGDRAAEKPALPTSESSGKVVKLAGQEDFKIPSHEEVMALKHKKKLIQSATEQFNAKPTKSITFMQENKLIQSPLDPIEIVEFMRKNPHLDKKQLGEYISNRKNLHVLEAFVQSFDFAGLRVDESLRLFLEAFRLPGEAPLIQLVLEHFAEHWRSSNDGVLADADAAFTLSYAVIMLNVDQHNKNHTQRNDPMTVEQFIRNLRGTNGNKDHDPEMLQEIYHAIRQEEIVMPAEQTGLVRENYLWKCVLKRGTEPCSRFLLAPNGFFDHDIFSIIWGSTVAALSYVFDKSNDPAVINRALNGFQRCAMIAAHYHMSDVFDNLVISLCKFTTLLTVNEPPLQFVPNFGMNPKALMATRMVFTLVQKHGDILRDGWRNITECLLQLFKCQMLPKAMMEAEDYIASAGRIKLFREEVQENKVEQGFLNSFVSFISMSSEAQPKERTPEEEEYAQTAQKCIKDCNLESLISESKFLLAESLQEMIRYLIIDSDLDEVDDEHARLFFLEMITKVAIQNRDRIQVIWMSVSDHLARLIMSSSSVDKQFMLERSVTSLLRLAVRLSRKEDLASTVVQSLQILLAMKIQVVRQVAAHIAFGLHELLRNNAANIHETHDWAIIFALIEMVGTGANLEIPVRVPASAVPASAVPASPRTAKDEDSGHESETNTIHSGAGSPMRERSESISSSGGWIVLGGGSSASSSIKGFNGATMPAVNGGSRSSLEKINQFVAIKPRKLVWHNSLAYLKCCESLGFLVRDVAHITPDNFFSCVQALRTFVEASFVPRRADQDHGGSSKHEGPQPAANSRSQVKKTPAGRQPPMRRAQSAPNHHNSDYEADESDSDDLSSEYHHVALQLLDLMYTLHTRAGAIYKSWAEEGGNEALADETSLWGIAWCPLLQGMARFCTDRRSLIRTTSLTTLQRALLFPELQNLSPAEWEGAFNQVLFPMLNQLLTKSTPGEKTAMEETRTRAAALLGKVYLQHLQALATLPTFTALCMTILDFNERFMKSATSDHLADAIPETLKNMLLVMDATPGVFFSPEGHPTQTWRQTWERLDTFLPNLMKELFNHKDRTHPSLAALEQTATVSNGSVASEPIMIQERLPHSHPESLPSNFNIEALATASTMSDPVGMGQPPLSPMDAPIMSSAVFQSVPNVVSAVANEPLPPPCDMIKASSTSDLSEKPRMSQGSFTFEPLPRLPGLPSSTVRNATTVTTVHDPPPLARFQIPSMPEIAPLPPPPISLAQSPPVMSRDTPSNGFQPIHVANPTSSAMSAPMVNPKAIPAPNPQLSSYFSHGAQLPSTISNVPGNNILTAAFSPTLPTNSTNPVVLGGQHHEEPPTSGS